jgi:hypothetical protein
MPTLTASSKFFGDPAVISVTRATDIAFLRLLLNAFTLTLPEAGDDRDNCLFVLREFPAAALQAGNRPELAKLFRERLPNLPQFATRHFLLEHLEDGGRALFQLWRAQPGNFLLHLVQKRG